jgi:hypothetical protein
MLAIRLGDVGDRLGSCDAEAAIAATVRNNRVATALLIGETLRRR